MQSCKRTEKHVGICTYLQLQIPPRWYRVRIWDHTGQQLVPQSPVNCRPRCSWGTRKWLGKNQKGFGVSRLSTNKISGLLQWWNCCSLNRSISERGYCRVAFTKAPSGVLSLGMPLADYAHLITTCIPRFSDLLTALALLIKKSTFCQNTLTTAEIISGKNERA